MRINSGKHAWLWLIGFWNLLCCAATWAQEPPQLPARTPVQIARGTQGMVVAQTPLAADIGRDILEAGGNAVDATVAVAIALTVTWPEAGNIAGGGFMMVAPPGKDVVCIEYREKAPASAHVHSFSKWENHYHARMAGVPGTIAGLAEAHRLYGSLPWRVLVEPSVALAEQGFIVDDYLAYSLNSLLVKKSVREDERYAELRRVLGHPDGKPWQAGERLQQPDLARTLRCLAEQGPEAFYLGSIAQLIVAEMEQGEGLITAEDLRDYSPVVRKPISGTIGPYTLYGAPPPCSGGITVLQQLRIIEMLRPANDPARLWTADQVHVMVEAMRRGFRERAAHLGDADFIEIPPHVGTAEEARRLAETIHPERATPSAELAGGIPLSDGPYESLETTHFSIIDADGMGVSNTYTLEESFGSRIVVRGGGFLLNNEMGDFNWYPGYTNREGKIGTPANQIQPGKRMLSSQSPTIVKRDGRVVLLVGSPGGRTIINTVTEILAQTLLFGRSLPEAIDAPRFHHQWFPDVIRFEGDDLGIFREMTPELIRRGHTVAQPRTLRQGSAHAIAIDPDTAAATGAADWRRGGAARAVHSVQTP
ncbi:MAG: gamma-glutamyltransferase [Planctomycetaceae bacterium]|nr:gamma-glutamyltransferase [Planctomycetaceae bacterium]